VLPYLTAGLLSAPGSDVPQLKKFYVYLIAAAGLGSNCNMHIVAWSYAATFC
jgi:hypothetical protein